MATVADNVIDFIQQLHGMDVLQIIDRPLEQERHSAIDLRTAMIYEASADSPEAQQLIAESPNGSRFLIHTSKLIESLLLRHAEAESIINGASVESCYASIHENFKRKTNFS